jgi:hypothetical protein
MDVLEKELGLRIAPDYTHFLVGQNTTIEKPVSVFDVGGIPIFSIGSISMGIAKAKAGKTTVVAWMVASMLRSGKKVLWIDTEQGEYYASRTQSWILEIAFLDKSENLKYFDLRTLNYQQRNEAIEQYLNIYDVDVMVIDGVRDLLSDINNNDQATECAGNLMRWSSDFSCHILSILHMNKGDGNARGSIGTEITNKSETVFQVETDKENQIIVSPDYMRGPRFEPFALMRSEKGIPYLLDSDLVLGVVKNRNTKKKPTEYEFDFHCAVLKEAFKETKELNGSEFKGSYVVAFNALCDEKMTLERSRGFLEFYKEQNYLAVRNGARNNEKLHSLNVLKEDDSI